MFKAFFKDSLIYLIPSFLSRGISIVLLPLYTRVLSPSDFGSLDLFLVFANIVNLSIALEVNQGAARYYTIAKSAKKKSQYFSSAYWFTLACYSIFAISALSFYPELSKFILRQQGLETAFIVGIYIFG